MEPEQSVQFEHILNQLEIGAVVVECGDLRIRYANSYFLSLLSEAWRVTDICGQRLADIIPAEIISSIEPLLRSACNAEESITYTDLPYEGLLSQRGRTYWRVTLSPSPAEQTLLLLLEDVTTHVRARLLLRSIQHISSVITGPFALPEVLDRILQAVQELIGSTRCAILLLEQPGTSLEGKRLSNETSRKPLGHPTVQLAAQKGLHLISQDWRPHLNEQLLLERALRQHRALIIEDTSTRPELELPMLNDQGTPRRPGSVLSVPIFDPGPTTVQRDTPVAATDGILGAIEVYHRRPRGFPAEEVELLEQFAQQAGLAIHNARMFLHVNSLARTASRNVRQRQNIMQAIPDGVIIYDARWRVADANPAVKSLFGWTDDVLGLSIFEVQAKSKFIFEEPLLEGPEAIAILEERALARAIDELKIIDANGRSVAIRRSYAPIHDDLGDIFAFVVIYHDVTEQTAARERIEAEVTTRTAELAQRNQTLQQVQAEQELESARLQALLERLPSGVILVARENRRIEIINRQAVLLLRRMGLPLAQTGSIDEISQRLIGLSAELVFQNLIVYGPTGDPIPRAQRPLTQALEYDQANEGELLIPLPDGQTLYLLSNAAPLRTSSGASGAILVWHDISNLKALERVREDFFTSMAHELKTPLANIRAHLSALQASDLQWSAAEQQTFLRTADEQVERLVGMINQFLDASRVEAGALRLELEPIIIPELFEDLEDRLEALIANSQRRLVIQLPAQLPAVVADYELITRVLINLLSNAFRYAPEGGMVCLAAEPIRSHSGRQRGKIRAVELRVSDDGPGLSSKQQADLFTRFSTFAASRRPATNRPGQPAEVRRRNHQPWSPGTGLGLYISRGIIEAHQSQLKLTSNPGHGATFAFQLPVANRSSTPDNEDESEAR